MTGWGVWLGSTEEFKAGKGVIGGTCQGSPRSLFTESNWDFSAGTALEPVTPEELLAMWRKGK